MSLILFFCFYIAVLGAAAMPRVGPYIPPSLFNATTTIAATVTSNMTTTRTFTMPSSTIQLTSTTASESPSATPSTPSPFVISAFKPDSDIHLLPMNAAGLKFWLGGDPATYCPSNIEELSLCPAGEVTGLWGSCSMAAEVPGGQSIYAAPDGSLGFTQAHSIYIPLGSEQCPLSIIGNGSGMIFGVDVDAFDATGLMACPSTSVSGDNFWQVFLAMDNATVPSGDVLDCLPFYAIAAPYNLGNDSDAAWQYT